MKTMINTFNSKMENLETAAHSTELNEAMISTQTLHPKTAFGIADLWNMERSRRVRMVRRYLA